MKSVIDCFGVNIFFLLYFNDFASKRNFAKFLVETFIQNSSFKFNEFLGRNGLFIFPSNMKIPEKKVLN